jgi:hypothetical protein
MVVAKGGASMYVDLLRHASASSPITLSSEELFDHLMTCRREMLMPAPATEESAYRTLALEVAYDGALVRLCVLLKLSTDIALFAHPIVERRRLEHALAAIGINLADHARRRQDGS